MTDEAAVPRPRILYVDDDAGLARLVERQLGRAGFDVVTAGSGVEGLRWLEREPFDLLALDHHMPEMNGLAVLERLGRWPSHPPVIYVTGAEDTRLAVAALKAGARDYVIKAHGQDFFDLLVESVRTVLRQVALQRQTEAAEREIREAKRQLEVLVARQEAMIREVNHRVANSLQMVSSLVRMQSGTHASPEVRSALIDTQSRIEAIIQVHRKLYTSGNVEEVEMEPYLGSLLTELELSLGARERGIQVQSRVEPLRLVTDRAITVGVIVAELVTNALKYAFAGRESGYVEVGLRREDKHCVLEVRDDGVGFAPTETPGGTGLGTRIVRAMATSLAAEPGVSSGPQGTVVKLAFA